MQKLSPIGLFSSRRYTTPTAIMQINRARLCEVLASSVTRPKWCWRVAIFAFLFLNSWCWGAVPLRVSREDFAKAIGHIKKGMAEREVLSILGQPDDIRTQI